MTLINYVLMFFIYSMIGWTIETTYRSLGERRIINTGFLYGPLCPIYGTGALVFEILLKPFASRWWLVVILGMVFADIVEYLTSFIMEKLFHARWWDYTDEFCNLNGRICLKHTCYWALFAFLYVYFISPVYGYMICFMPDNIRITVMSVIAVVFSLDLLFTVRSALDIKKIMLKIEALKDEINFVAESLKFAAENIVDDAAYRLEDLQASVKMSQKLSEKRVELAEKLNEIHERVNELASRQKSRNYSFRTKRLYGESGIRIRAESLVKEIEEKANQIKDKFLK